MARFYTHQKSDSSEVRSVNVIVAPLDYPDGRSWVTVKTIRLTRMEFDTLDVQLLRELILRGVCNANHWSICLYWRHQKGELSRAIDRPDEGFL